MPLESFTPIAVVIAVGAIGILGRFLVGGRRPRQQSFRCGRCQNYAMHSNRTIEAWRRGKTRFFCNSCHGEWVKSQPQDSKPAAVGRSGCFGAVVLVVAVPAILIATYVLN